MWHALMLRVAGLTTVATVVLLFGGCTTQPDPHVAQSSEQQERYVTAEGSVETTPAPSRGQPITLAGTTLGGEEWNLASVPAGEIILVIAWGSWCDPCRAQVGEVESAAHRLRAQDKPIQVVGLDYMDDADEGTAFQLQHWVDFLSLRYDGGTNLRAIPGGIPTVPTTLVLDRFRRIAARIVGPTDADTLTRLVTDAQAEG